MRRFKLDGTEYIRNMHYEHIAADDEISIILNKEDIPGCKVRVRQNCTGHHATMLDPEIEENRIVFKITEDMIGPSKTITIVVYDRHGNKIYMKTFEVVAA